MNAPLALPKKPKKRAKLPPPIVRVITREVRPAPFAFGSRGHSRLVFEIINLELISLTNNASYRGAARKRSAQKALIRRAIRLHVRSLLGLPDCPRCKHCGLVMPWVAPKIRRAIPCEVRKLKQGRKQICQPLADGPRPVIVQFTRISNGEFQLDNLWACVKPCIDSVADALGVDDAALYVDGSDVLMPKQEKRGPGVFGVIVDLTWPEKSEEQR